MEYRVEYSKRRTVSISVKDGKIVVKAPHKASEKQIAAILEKHQRWIENRIAEDAARNKLEAGLDEQKIKELKRNAKIYFAHKTAEFSEIMGIKYGRITITSAKTRFGSCSSRGNISYSYRLMLYPELAREYVVVHELAHIKEMNHSPKFYAIVESYLPDYKDRKRLLKL
ncbi:MAG: M48 family metallopeptidase [Clostridia bacterium]|nr:M48 family metallopeptidase [Clostridia bacterium]